jgi:hypothetical protein
MAAPPSAAPSAAPGPRAGGLAADVAAVFLRPDLLFGRLPVHNRWAQAVALLMLVQALYGLGLISTGVPDYDIAARTQREVNKAAARLQGDESSAELATTVEALEKGETFAKLLARVMLLVGSPVRLFVGVVVVASLLFVAVAFRQAAKPDWSLLAGIVAFATFVEAPRLLLRLLLVAALHVSRVETSVAAFVAAPQTDLGTYMLLRRLDPFDLWYWCLVGYGLCKTGQLTRGWAVTVVVALALFAAVGSCVAETSDLAEINYVMNLESQ